MSPTVPTRASPQLRVSPLTDREAEGQRDADVPRLGITLNLRLPVSRICVFRFDFVPWSRGAREAGLQGEWTVARKDLDTPQYPHPGRQGKGKGPLMPVLPGKNIPSGLLRGPLPLIPSLKHPSPEFINSGSNHNASYCTCNWFIICKEGTRWLTTQAPFKSLLCQVPANWLGQSTSFSSSVKWTSGMDPTLGS